VGPPSCQALLDQEDQLPIRQNIIDGTKEVVLVEGEVMAEVHHEEEVRLASDI
jgi:hypothetical protein